MKIKADNRGRISLAQAGIGKPHQEWEVTEDESGVHLTNINPAFPDIGESGKTPAIYVDPARFGGINRVAIDFYANELSTVSALVEELADLTVIDEVHVKSTGVGSVVFDLLSRSKMEGLKVYGHSMC